MTAYNDNLLFIHVPKCGGVSVKKFLKDNVPGMVFSGEPESKLPVGHTLLSEIEPFTGRAPESFQKILVAIRNPYLQQLSQFIFWAHRYLRGGIHMHDVYAWRYVCGDVVANDLLRAMKDGASFLFEPRHLNLTGFVGDRTCEFHAVEAEFLLNALVPLPGVSLYADSGGMYRSWITVDDVVPPNVEVIRLDELASTLPAAAAEFIGGKPTSVPHLNQSPYETSWRDFYTPLAARLVEQRFAWAFANCYEIDESLQ